MTDLLQLLCCNITIVTLTIVNLLAWFLIFLIVFIISIVYHILVAWYIQFCITPQKMELWASKAKWLSR